MTRTILVPLDGSPLAEEVLPLATEVASRLKATLILFSTVPPAATWDPTAATVQWDKEEGHARTYLESHRERVSAQGVDARIEVHLGNAAEQILKACEDMAVDMLAISTHGRSGVSRWMFGSVARQVLEVSTLPALIVRHHKHRPPASSISKILVPLDGSPVAESVVPGVEELAKAFGASITLYTAIAPIASYPGLETAVIPASTGEIIADMQKQADDYLRGLANAVASRGVDIKAITSIDLSADGILDAAAKTGADLIAIGTHGRSGVKRAVLGSVADSVIRRAEVPCLAIRPAEQKP